MAKDDPMSVDEQAAVPVEAKKTGEVTMQGSLKAIVGLLESTVKTKDTRLLAGRLHRQTAVIRSQLTPEILAQFISTYLAGPDAVSSQAFLLEQVCVLCCGSPGQLGSDLALTPWTHAGHGRQHADREHERQGARRASSCCLHPARDGDVCLPARALLRG